jgi:polysaccharide deacetylase 2 family uncharacterized protein YibQ
MILLLRLPRLLLILILLPLLLSGCRPFSGSSEKGGQQETVEQSALQTTGQKTIIFEEPEAPESRPASLPDAPPKKTGKSDSRPQVAILIDDMGYHRRIGEKLLALDVDLSFSFLPQAPFTTQLEIKAYERGRDILLHLPMEASDSKWNPGPGALMLAASPAELTETVKKNILSVPHAIGANNHMGSKFTENRAAMHTVLTVLKHQGMFFVDSFTTAKSTGMDEARAMGIRTNRRHIFLDNVQNTNKICRQLDKLAALAQKQHSAIGIGHPYRATLQALQNCTGTLQKTVRIVPVHELVE